MRVHAGELESVGRPNIMGLDGVELIMAYEEAFGVQITDQDAVRMRTPRDIIEFVASRVPIADHGPCLQQRAFYCVRSALLELSPVERRRLIPLTPLAHVFPLVPPAEVSRRLKEKLQLQLRLPLDSLSTVGDVALWLVENVTHTIKRGEPWTRQEIARVVKRLTLRQLGDIDYGEEKMFVQDFGIS